MMTVLTFRRSDVFVLSALVAALVLPLGAVASEELPASELVEEGYTQVFFGEPGEVTFDASGGHAAFPVSETQLSFKDWHEYALFLQETFNAELEFDEGGGVVSLFLTVSTIGEPLALSPSLEDLIPVRDPIATMVGGISGTVEIKGEVHCVNQDRCTNARSPLALGPLDASGESGGDANHEAVATVVEEMALQGSVTPTATPPPFTIKSYAYVPRPPLFVGGVLRDYFASTTQGEGGYNRVVVEYGLRRVCPIPIGMPMGAATEPSLLPAAEPASVVLVPPGPSVFLLTYSYSERFCYYVPFILSAHRGRNYLFVDMTWKRAKFVGGGVCKEEEVHYRPEDGYNVPAVRIHARGWWQPGDSTKVYDIVFSNGIDTTHAGMDFDTGGSDFDTSGYGTGVPQICTP